jgi:thiamine biosynthesis lipoprotein
MEATEARLSTWRENSELAALNRAPAGQPVEISRELAEELAAAAHCAEMTAGAFDPGIGTLLAAWGMRRGGHLPTPEQIRLGRAAAGISRLELASSAVGTPTALRRHPDLVIDEGAFGKGAGLDRAAAALAVLPTPVRAFLNVGGQVLVTGGGEPWPVELSDPGDRRRPVLALALDGGSLATSGNGERGIWIGGERRSHLLDPRTGEPALDFGNLAVIAPDALTADCLSTGLYVLGPEAALAWAGAHPGVEVVVLSPSGAGSGLRVRATAGLAGRLRPLVEGVEVRFEAPGGAFAAKPGQAGSEEAGMEGAGTEEEGTKADRWRAASSRQAGDPPPPDQPPAPVREHRSGRR